MEIISYRNCNDADIRFEDGTVREHMSYGAFKKGQVRHPDDANAAKAIWRIGERRKNKWGRVMEIIAYRSSKDIDVAFEDGTVREHRRYQAFKNGNISHPSDTVEAKAMGRVGEKRKNNAGQTMEIAAYRNFTDIDVAFEDGTIRKHKSYQAFKNGEIRHHPLSGSAPERILAFLLESAGFSKRLASSEDSGRPVSSVEIDTFNEEHNIGVEYDGARWHQDTEKDLRKNQICRQAGVTLLRIREKGCPELDDPSVPVFEVDPSRWKNLRAPTPHAFGAFKDELERSGFTEFLEGRLQIALPGLDKFSWEDYLKWLEKSDYTWAESRRVGERGINNQGLPMVIDVYRNALDIDVKFEDGAFRKHVAYGNFKRGAVRHPDDTSKAKAESRLGERRKNNAGRTMEIAAYRTCNDMDIRFEDGTVREHVQYGSFKKGMVSHPDDTAGAKAEKRIGERRKNSRGQTMEIVACRSFKDIDVRFSDGSVRKHLGYGDFKKGYIRHPAETPKAKAADRIGERRKNNQGQMMEIAAYRNAGDMDVRFEDGTVKKHADYGAFKKGSVSHP